MNDVIDFEILDDRGPQTYTATYDVAVDELDRDELASVGSVTINVTAKEGDLDDEYVTDGTVTFTADLTCSRCAEAYPFANTSTFHVRFRPRPEVSAENEEVEITNEEELDVEFYSDRSIPLRDLAIEQIQLSLPMKPLCDEGCLGLCLTCGANRQRENCSCGESIVDERWGALKDLREELAKKKNV
ncbi:MAG: hypothetical protein QOJ98_1917 [Acidobacteriota bacterium]|jgi:uncharacterized protein|nr:hypothetical protein [Acidobacteriota bacterium]